MGTSSPSRDSAVFTTTSRWTAPTSTTRSSASSAAASGRRSPSTSTRCRRWWWSPAVRTWMDSAYSGAFGVAPLRLDYGPISRTNDARAALVKLDWRLSDRHNLSLKYNYTWSEQKNGTFDVDFWGRSANGLERDWSNAVNGSPTPFLSSRPPTRFPFPVSPED